MKANELRIGNFLEYWKRNEIVEISAIHNGCLYANGYEEGCLCYFQFKGILLTKEWFKKLGFTYYPLPTKSGREVGYYTLKYGNRFKINRSDDIYSFINFRKEIKNVHQLQNLYFALTGEELTIKKATE